MTHVVVTDHAIVRYLERALGIDIDPIRRHIADLAARGVEAGATGVIIEDVKLVLVKETVVTVYLKHWPSVDLRRDRVAPADAAEGDHGR